VTWTMLFIQDLKQPGLERGGIVTLN
jgi:hypothetical protein